MTRREVFALLSAAGATACQRISRGAEDAGATLRLRARRRATEGDSVRAIEEILPWRAARTAIIICDMWDDHYCLSAVRRLEAMIPLMNEVVRGARALGVKIVHAPSGTMEFYEGEPQRQRMIGAPYAQPPVEIAKWCHLDPSAEAPLPIDDQNGPCDDLNPRERKRFYTRQHPAIVIAPEDGISDSGQEIHNYFEQHGIRNVVLMGVHTNMCVLGRPFGIRQQVRLGKNVLLTRDLTDAMYDPRDRPWVSHEEGTRLVIEHIERYWCPSIEGRDLTVAAEVVS